MGRQQDHRFINVTSSRLNSICCSSLQDHDLLDASPRTYVWCSDLEGAQSSCSVPIRPEVGLPRQCEYHIRWFQNPWAQRVCLVRSPSKNMLSNSRKGLPNGCSKLTCSEIGPFIHFTFTLVCFTPNGFCFLHLELWKYFDVRI